MEKEIEVWGAGLVGLAGATNCAFKRLAQTKRDV